jgi:capsular exopolysaccharide synthesis family protein
MSKIFQALHGAQNEVSELLPALIGDDSTAPANGSAVPGEALAVPEIENPASVSANGGAPKTLSDDVAAPSAMPEPAFTAEAIREVALAIPATLSLLPFEDPRAHAAEQYRILRTKITHHPMRPKIIVVSSANPGDGKTFTAINLAGVLSLKGDAKVLLIDGDFRRSAIYRQLGIAASPGLAEVILGSCGLESAIVRAQQFPNLHILVNGKLEDMNPSELLDSPHWRALCQAVRRRYQYVIIDTPPVSAVADFDLIQMASDGTVLVARPEHTNRSACFKAIEAIPREKLLGMILNCSQPWFLNKSHGYGYGYGYGYGGTPKDDK